jgi:hypothetical protein
MRQRKAPAGETGALWTEGGVSGDAIAFALMRSRKIIRGLKEGLTEEERAFRPIWEIRASC